MVPRLVVCFTFRDSARPGVYYKHNGKEQVAKVGEPEPLTKEMVIAIGHAPLSMSKVLHSLS
jgi:hypothetical protein